MSELNEFQTSGIRLAQRNAPGFGRDVLPFALCGALGVGVGWWAIVQLIGVIVAVNLASVSLFVGIGAAGLWFAGSLLQRQARYDEWRGSPLQAARPAPAQPAPPAPETWWITTDNIHKRLPSEPTPGAIRKYCQAIDRGRAGWAEREAARFGYDRLTWETLRDFFIENKWAGWKSEGNRKLGSELNPEGMAVIREIANQYPPNPFTERPQPDSATHARSRGDVEEISSRDCCNRDHSGGGGMCSFHPATYTDRLNGDSST